MMGKQGRRGISLERFAKGKRPDFTVARKLRREEEIRKLKAIKRYESALKEEGYEIPARKSERDELEDDNRGTPDELGQVSKQYRKKIKRQEILYGKKSVRLNGENKPSAYVKAMKIAESRAKQRQDLEAARAENLEIAQKKREKRRKLSRRLNRKTSKGQPVMRHKIELVLSQVEKNCLTK